MTSDFINLIIAAVTDISTVLLLGLVSVLVLVGALIGFGYAFWYLERNIGTSSGFDMDDFNRRADRLKQFYSDGIGVFGTGETKAYRKGRWGG